MEHRQRRHGRWSLAVLTAAGLLAVSGGIAVASPSFHDHRPGRRHHDGSSSTGTVLYVAPRATSSTGGTPSCSRTQPCTLADAAHQATSGETILVEPGKYQLPPGITISNGVTVEARGRRVILSGTAPVLTLGGPSTPSTTASVVRGFHFDDVSAGPSGSDSVIVSTSASDVGIVDNTFSGTSANGIGLQDVSNGVVQGNVIVGTGGGVALTGTATTSDANDQILDNTIRHVSGVGIQVSSENGVLVRGNDVTDAGGTSSGAAIELASSGPTSSDITVIGNTASRSYVGLSVGSGALGSGIVAIQNNFVGDASAGIADAATGGSLNAVLDWWGCQSGPSATSSPGAGTSSSGCSAVTGTVDTTPAATGPIELPPAPPLPPGLLGDPAGNGPAKHADHPGKHKGSSNHQGRRSGRNGTGSGNHRRGHKGS